MFAKHRKIKESRWSGSVEDAFFRAEVFDRNRILKQPEYEASGRSGKGSYYVLAADIGRKECETAIIVFKCTPQPQGPSLKTIVNIYTLYDMHFEEQAIQIKKLFYKYKARRVVIDANGIGMAIMDDMVKSQIDPDTGDIYPDFGVYNDKDNEYRKYQTTACEFDAIYAIKANAPINTEAHSIVKSWLTSGKIKFLIDERTAKAKLLGTVKGQNMKPEERAEYLKPFTYTSILREEMCNLRQENDGANIILKQANRGIGKDKFSALEYGLYYLKEEEDNENKKRKKFNAKDWMLMN